MLDDRIVLALLEARVDPGQRPITPMFEFVYWHRDFEPQTLSSQPNTTCNTVYAFWTNPRFVAGGPIQADRYKCQLKPIDFADYMVTFTAGEIARLTTILPNGVCDWSKPGVNQTAWCRGLPFVLRPIILCSM